MLSNILLPPAPNFTADMQAADRFQPANPVAIGMTGAIREQQVAQIQFFGLQFNPVQKTVKLYTKMRVKIHFNSTTRSTVVEDSPAFDRMLQHLLLNDTSANRLLRSTVTTRKDCPPPLPPALKLTIDKTGVYALSYDDFLALGLDVSLLDSHMIHMSHQGEAVPIFILGEEDGVFGPGDIMFFYAQATETLYTRSNIYWLSLKLEGGARLNFREATPNVNDPSLTTFKQTVHFEENHIYSPKWPNDLEKEHLFWFELKGGEGRQKSFNLHHPSTGRNYALFKFKL
ncbi:Propetide, peptidase C25 domain protein [Candidatus Thiomargarita nelsonii]|uniref:Propetide, peptidase C25 domain protein n=1 Tax=Candidatus Thiomargarita nelsonii TaxID=1003181 RepID=A0A176S647_9GAMM|nr:Propetide, peptidase C25 domain protein [Candidatus Thiomargarita nelsonii]